ncbi:YdeI/OmpD-associated family protein [Microbacterium sp. F1-18]
MRIVRFETTLSQFGNNTGIEVPFSVLDALGGGRRPAVSVTVNGFSFRSTVGSMRGLALVPFSAERRRESGLAGGDAIVVDIELDEAPREVETPDDLVAALAEAGATAAFDRLAPSARKAHVVNVESAKTPETRARRIAAIITKLG